MRDTNPKEFKRLVEEERKEHRGESVTYYEGEKSEPVPEKYLKKLEDGEDVINEDFSGPVSVLQSL